MRLSPGSCKKTVKLFYLQRKHPLMELQKNEKSARLFVDDMQYLFSSPHVLLLHIGSGEERGLRVALSTCSFVEGYSESNLRLF
jgi:hypothetical protein